MLLAWRGSDYYARRVFRRPHSFPPSSFFSLQTSYIFMRVLCCMSIRPSVHPSRLSICTSVSPSIRARNTRACSGTRACERVLRRRAQIRTFDAHVYSVHTYVCMCVYVCVCVYTHTHTCIRTARVSVDCVVVGVGARNARYTPMGAVWAPYIRWHACPRIFINRSPVSPPSISRLSTLEINAFARPNPESIVILVKDVLRKSLFSLGFFETSETTE